LDGGAVLGAGIVWNPRRYPDGSVAEKQRFLVCYDYGMGGLWGLIHAESIDAIHGRYPELTIVHDRPAFLQEEARWQQLVEDTYDIDDPPRGLLTALLADRAKRR
jgi:hypothetical protein